MRDRGVRGQSRVGAAQVLAHPGHLLREALHVQLVDDGRVPRTPEQLVALPVEGVVDHDRLGDRRGVVGLVQDEVVVARVRERPAAIPEHRALDRLRVGVDQELVGVEAVALLGRPGPVDAVAVALARADAGQIPVPVVRRVARELDPGLDVVVVEQAQLDALGVLRRDREVGAVPVPGRAERKRLSGPRSHRETLDDCYPAASAERSPRSAHTEKTIAATKRQAEAERDVRRVACQEAAARLERVGDRVEPGERVQRRHRAARAARRPAR